MTWLRVESCLPNHRKVRTAGDQLGQSGAGRVLAIWLVGATYAVDQLTDGFVPRSVLDDRNFDKKPSDVIAALVEAGLIHEVTGGYQFHDFDEYNPSGEDLKAKRKDGADRKRRWRAEQKALKDAQKAAVRAMSRDASSGTKPGHQPDIERDTAWTIANVPAMSAVLAPAYDHARSEPDPQVQEQKEQCGNPHRVLVKLAHVVLDDISAGSLPPDEAIEELKLRAAKARIDYDGRAVTKALESAEYQRNPRRA